MSTTIQIQRKQKSFRLREDLLDILKVRAAQANRTLNNYVESLLLKEVCSDEPNETTKAAIKEAKSGKDLKNVDMTNFDSFVKSCLE
jgi:plasmid stability protein